MTNDGTDASHLLEQKKSRFANTFATQKQMGVLRFAKHPNQTIFPWSLEDPLPSHCPPSLIEPIYQSLTASQIINQI